MAGYSVTVACIDPGTLQGVEVMPCDGQNWEEFMSKEKEKVAAMSRAA